MENDKKYDLSVREELDRVDWDSVFPKVLNYAIWRTKKIMGLQANRETLGEKARRLVQEAVARAYGIGTRDTYRNWNKETCPDIVVFLNGIIRSMTSHTVEHETKFVKESLFSENGSFKNNKLFAAVDTITQYYKPKSPEEKLIETDNFQKLMDVLDRLENEDEDLGMVILCIKDGVSKPRHISQETGLEISKINNLLKKLRRKLKDFKPKKQKTLC